MKHGDAEYIHNHSFTKRVLGGLPGLPACGRRLPGQVTAVFALESTNYADLYIYVIGVLPRLTLG